MVKKLDPRKAELRGIVKVSKNGCFLKIGRRDCQLVAVVTDFNVVFLSYRLTRYFPFAPKNVRSQTFAIRD